MSLVIHARHIETRAGRPTIQNTVVSLGIDALDPAYAPGTGTPKVAGFTNREAIAMVRAMSRSIRRDTLPTTAST
jgi:arginase family enzyme